MNKYFKRSALTVALLIGINIAILPAIASAATQVQLGSASSFGVLASTTVTNAATATTVTGTAGSMVGVTPGTTITGAATLSSGTQVTGVTAPAPAAMAAAQAAYTAGRAETATSLAPTELGSQTLTAGAYSLAAATETLTGNLILNGAGNANAVFIFDTSFALSTAAGSSVTLTNGAQACNIFWLVGSTATLGSASTFVGHLIANGAVTVSPGAVVSGSLISLNSGVSLSNNLITNNNCAAVVAPPAPVRVQTTTLDSVTPGSCAVSGPVTVTLNGEFPTPITSVTVNGTAIPTTSWIQTGITVAVTTAVSSSVPVTIELFNGTTALRAVQTFICASAAVVPIIPAVMPLIPLTTTATIHVIKVVNNKYGGTAVPGNFNLSLRHWSYDVVGSPDVGMAAPGRTYIVAPGTYVVGEVDGPLFSKYINSFDITGQATNFIDVKAGDDITVVQTNTELPPPGTVVTPTPPVTTPPATTPGGTLPATGSPWFNLLLLGVGAMVVGGVAVSRRKTAKI